MVHMISKAEKNIPLSKKTPAPKQKEERQHQTVQKFQPVIKDNENLSL